MFYSELLSALLELKERGNEIDRMEVVFTTRNPYEEYQIKDVKIITGSSNTSKNKIKLS